MWLPACLPDELLISRMLRHVILYGWSGLHQLYSILGASDKKKSIHPLLTSGLNRLAFSPGDTAQGLLWQQTLAPVYMYFLTGHRDVISQAMLCGDSCRTLRACQFPVSGCGCGIVLKSEILLALCHSGYPAIWCCILAPGTSNAWCDGMSGTFHYSRYN